MSSIDVTAQPLRARPNVARKGRKETAGGGITIERWFTKPGVDVYDTCEWETRSALITNERGESVFEQKDVETPKFWSQMATNVVVSKYFRGHLGTANRESSVRQLVGRVVHTITQWGREAGYFATEADGDTFRDELAHILLYQMASFNSPVWFNVGIEPKPQCSACFINAVQDTMDSILGLAKTEGMLFKYGSGTGSNLSGIRSSKELLAGGGTASGPVSFMRGYDAFAGVIKSGGKTRRAAKMVILNVDHPDILDFIESKEKEEKKAWALIDAGYDGAFNAPGGAYDSVQFQNANHSVRVTDEFMEAYEKDADWSTWSVVQPKQKMATYKAREMMRKMAEAAWVCGDPGMQFDTTVNDWHPCPNTARINASNPCSEYMFLDDSACNLASLNLMRFYNGANGTFDVESYRAALRVVITAQEIVVDCASYPTPAIERNSHAFRPLGIGYANLGALLMARGVAYDSDEGRDYAAAMTSILSGESYAQSSRIAAKIGPFEGYAVNEQPFLRVIDKHRRAAYRINVKSLPADLAEAATGVWDLAYALGQENGYRNAQISVLAPTGTIAFMMDCDTTGIEPDIALVKYKKLVGGGMLKIVNQTVPVALKRLGYDDKQIQEIVQYIDENDMIEGAPHLIESHMPVFDCAFRPSNGTRSIHYQGHLKMMGAVQPFISGAISKTINMPANATIEEIEQAYYEAWKLGLKAVAVYRDGCKRSQPLSTARDRSGLEQLGIAPTAVRRKLQDERESITHKFSIGGHEGYITVGKYEDGTPGEIFITMAKEGSTISGLMDSFATMTSLALQHGVPLQLLVDKFTHMRFEPSGFTRNSEIPMAKSIMDYIFKWLAIKFLPRESQAEAGVILRDDDDVAGGGSGSGSGSSGSGSGSSGSGSGSSASASGLSDSGLWGSGSSDPGSSDSSSGSTSGAIAHAGKADANLAPPNARDVSFIDSVAAGVGVPAGNHHGGNGHAHPTGGTPIADGQSLGFIMPPKDADAPNTRYAAPIRFQQDAPSCSDCGSIMVRNGACYKCLNCGSTSGCS